jgi:uncharacterized protein YkwD
VLGNFLNSLYRWLTGGPPPKPVPPPRRTPPEVDLDKDEMVMRLLAAHNDRRGRFNLILNERLVEAAQAHAEWMARNRDLDHVDGVGRGVADRVRQTGYRAVMVGENVSCGQATVDRVMASWLASPGHRDNIVNAAYVHAGFGVQADVYGYLYWCVVFARPVPTGSTAASLRLVVSAPPALVSRG